MMRLSLKTLMRVDEVSANVCNNVKGTCLQLAITISKIPSKINKVVYKVRHKLVTWQYAKRAVQLKVIAGIRKDLILATAKCDKEAEEIITERVTLAKAIKVSNSLI